MIIRNRLIPFYPYDAINLFGVVFVRAEYWDKYTNQHKARIRNHEAIHSAQGRELLWIGFYIIYVFEWLVRLLSCGRRAYELLSFEREAYEHQGDPDYLKTRKHFAQWR